MKLYKYISFLNEHWAMPLIEQSLYFSTIRELRNPNDPQEFRHQWRYNSAFFRDYSKHFSDSYNRLFSKTRVLCLSSKLSSYCWQEFTKSKGLCYEFEFDLLQKSTDLTSGNVEYGEKEYIVPVFLLNKISDPKLRKLLKKKIYLPKGDLAYINQNLETETKHIFEKHILNELALKKEKRFSDESEYRYIHVYKDTPGANVFTEMQNGKVSFNSLGLKLSTIYTSDYQRFANLTLPIGVTLQYFPEN